MTPCVEWPGTRDKDGYGVRTIKGKQYRASRLVHEACIGPIPVGHVVRHKCDNPPCIEQTHLETGTVGDNNRDRAKRGRDAKGSQTHCVHNHQFTEQNTYKRPNGTRACKACRRARAVRYYERRTG